MAEECRVPAFAGTSRSWLLVNPPLGIDVTESINPYHAWLGIPSDVQHPNYYELLQLDSKEHDEAIIRTAAESAAARVRNFRPGKQAAAWAGLLDEIAKAKACLTDAAARAAYDQRIQSPNTETAKSVDQSPEPEIAPVNQDASLYPPGMAPPKTSPPSNHSRKNTAPDGDAKKAKPKTTRSENRKKSATAKHPRPTKAKPTQSTSSKLPTSKSSAPASEPKSDDKPTPKKIDSPENPNANQVPLNTPEPTSKPVNAHVAPPPEEKPSQWLLIIPITAVIILLTLFVLYIALFAST